MSLEFTRLNNVELVAEATDEANVLIEEGGEIKRVPKTEVGGGSEWDAIIDYNGVFNFSSTVFTLTEGNYEDIKSKLMNGIKPNILIRGIFEYGTMFYEYPTVLGVYLGAYSDAITFDVYNRTNSQHRIIALDPSNELYKQGEPA